MIQFTIFSISIMILSKIGYAQSNLSHYIDCQNSLYKQKYIEKDKLSVITFPVENSASQVWVVTRDNIGKVEFEKPSEQWGTYQVHKTDIQPVNHPTEGYSLEFNRIAAIRVGSREVKIFERWLGSIEGPKKVNAFSFLEGGGVLRSLTETGEPITITNPADETKTYSARESLDDSSRALVEKYLLRQLQNKLDKITPSTGESNKVPRHVFNECSKILSFKELLDKNISKFQLPPIQQMKLLMDKKLIDGGAVK